MAAAVAMPFVGCSRAVYAYEPAEQQAADDEDREVAIDEGELVYVIEKGEDGWWRIKKRPNGEDEGEYGLVPANYLEDAPPVAHAKALYDYEKQSPEELSFEEDADVTVYDKDDGDWYFCSVGSAYGLAPSNYIEEGTGASDQADQVAEEPAQAAYAAASPPPASTYVPPPPPSTYIPPPPPPTFGVRRPGSQAAEPAPEPDEQADSDAESFLEPKRPTREVQPPVAASVPEPVAYEEPVSSSDAYGHPNAHYAVQQQGKEGGEEEEEEETPPPKPMRPNVTGTGARNTGSVSNGDFRTWPVLEVRNRKQKVKGTLGIGNEKIIYSPEGAAPVRTWPITSLVTYSQEKKHVFIELDSPRDAASFDFHAGSSQAASEIASHLGLLVGAARASGLRDIARASGRPMDDLPEDSALARNSNRTSMYEDNSEDEVYVAPQAAISVPAKKYGVVLYDFEAQGADELSVKADTEVEILDDTSSEEWWKCRLGGHSGVVPSSYIERGKKKVEKKPRSMPAPASTAATERPSSTSERRQSRSNGRSNGHRSHEAERSAEKPRSLPDMAKVRTWTDKTGSFKVDAQLIGFADNSIQLHKLNGVKISVPVSKMSREDVKYVESLVERKRKLQMEREEDLRRQAEEQGKPTHDIAAIAREQAMNRKDYDWFEFFLNAGVDVHTCQRYANSFESDHMDESSFEDLTPELMRSLGLKEGDIIRVKRHLDKVLQRESRPLSRASASEVARSVMGPSAQQKSDDVMQQKTGDGNTPLFTSEDGGLLNNTRRNRPNSRNAASDVVDPTQLQRPKSESPPPTPEKPASMQKGKAASGFEDDAWTVKSGSPAMRQPEPHRLQQQPSGALKELEDLTGPSESQNDAPKSSTQAAAYPPAPSMPSMPLKPQPTVLPAPLEPEKTSAPQMVQQRTGFQPLDLPSHIPPFHGQSFTPTSAFGAQITGQVPVQYAAKTGGTAPSMDQLVSQMQQQQISQPTGGMQPLNPFMTGVAQQPMQTGFFQQAMPTGYQIPAQTGYQMAAQTGFQPAQTGFQPAQTGFQPFATGYQQPAQTGIQPFATGYQQPAQTGIQPFATGYQQPAQTGIQQAPTVFQQPMQTEFQQPAPNHFQQPFATGFQPAQTPFQQQLPYQNAPVMQTGFMQQQPPQQPFMAQQPMMVPQQQPFYGSMAPQQPMTGFMPQQQMPMYNQPQAPQASMGQDASMFRPTSFGLEPQKTGKANLYNATPDNPFGFD